MKQSTQTIKKLNLNCHGIVISYNEDDKTIASIASNMKEPETPNNALINSAIDGLESIILAHFCAGIDVSSPAYLEGIETACDALDSNIDDVEVDDSKVTIQRTREVSANATEENQYSINKDDWLYALEEYEDEATALFELQRECKVQRISCEVEIGEISDEFDVVVEEI